VAEAALQAYAPEDATTPLVVDNAAVNLDELAVVDTAAVETPATTVIIDTELEGPTTASTSPNTSTVVIAPAATNASNATSSSAWLLWLAGSGIAIILGLLFFGRRFRGQTDTSSFAQAAEQPHRRRHSDTETTDTENVEAIGVDYDLSDDSPTEENLVLDADLVMGTGLGAGSGDSVASDFVELPFEPVASVSDATDILPPMRTDEHSILDSEILPGEDDYDMSVIVDATRMPQPEDVTERDLKAVEIVPDDDTLVAENYTISKEVDYHVLEQDYEDEFTATQALNEEIARAAAELVERMESDDSDDDLTAALPLATVTELDITAQMPAQNNDVSDHDNPDAAGGNEAITARINTDDETVEMPVESGKAR
jgi:hypothetical protein